MRARHSDLPSEEEAEESHQQALYDQACLFLERMTGDTRQRFFAHHHSRADAPWRNNPLYGGMSEESARKSWEAGQRRQAAGNGKQTESDASEHNWRQNAFSADALRNMTFKPVTYVVPEIIPEGVTILAGKPKIGKSWLALDVALAVSGDRFLLGEIKPIQGDVLYAALEDNKRRLWKRVRKIMAAADAKWPPCLTLATRWRRLDNGGVDDIQDWAAGSANPRLVILDTLAGVRPDRNARETIYESDYKALRDLHAWSNEAGIAVLVLTHQRKMEADDPIDTISGSLGLAGCADTSIILARSQKGTTLYLRGRDVEEQEHAVTFSAETCRWTILGDAADVHRSYARGKILTALLEATDLMTPAEIASASGLTRNNVDQRLHHMLRDGEIIKAKRGSYAHAQRQELVSRQEP